MASEKLEWLLVTSSEPDAVAVDIVRGTRPPAMAPLQHVSPLWSTQAAFQLWGAGWGQVPGAVNLSFSCVDDLRSRAASWELLEHPSPCSLQAGVPFAAPGVLKPIGHLFSA